MKRIQIIFLLITAVSFISVLTDQEDKKYYSEYDTRFTCGLKYDFELLKIPDELKKSSAEEELSIHTIQNSAITSTQLKIIANISRQFFHPSSGIYFYSYKHFDLNDHNLKILIPSRAPPVYS